MVGVALGFATLQFVPFTLGVAGVLSERTLRAAMVLIAVACSFDAATLLRWARRQIAQRQREGPRALVWALVLTFGLVIGFFQALAPATDPDGVGYHLAVPQQWLADGTIGFMATYTPTNSPSGAEMLFAIGLGTIGDSGAKVLHLSACALAGIAAYLAGRRVAGRPGGVAAGLIVLLGPFGVARLSGTALIVGFVALMVAIALLAWLIWSDSRQPYWLVVVGAACGFAVSFKLTAAAVPIALAAASFAVSRTGTRRIGARAVAVATAAFLVPTVPWLIRAAVTTGNPLFPVLARYIPSRDFPADMAMEYERFNRLQHWGGQWARNLSTDSRQLLLWVAAAVVVAVAAVFVTARRGRRLDQVMCGIVAAVVLVQLFAVGFYPRYWIPSALVLALPALHLVRHRLDSRWIGRIGLATACLLTAAQVRTFLQLSPISLVASSISASGREEYFDRTVGLRALYDYANTQLPADSVVLQSYLCAGFYLDVDDYCGDMLQGSIRFDRWDHFTADLDKHGVTHVITRAELANGGPRPFDEVGGNVGLLMRDDLYASLTRLLRERGRLLIGADEFGLYQIVVEQPDTVVP
jgi:hypothetical protein